MRKKRLRKAESILRYIKKFYAENGYVPTTRDLCKHFRYKSTSSIAYYMEELYASGKLIPKGKTYIVKGFKITFDDDVE